MPIWKEYQKFEYLSKFAKQLAASHPFNNLYNNYYKDFHNLNSIIDTAKKNQGILSAFNSFENSELGIELFQEIEKTPLISPNDVSQIFFLIFLALTISFYHADFAKNIIQHIHSSYNIPIFDNDLDDIDSLFLLKDIFDFVRSQSKYNVIQE